MDDVPASLLLDKVARSGATHLARSVRALGLRPKHVGLLAAISASESTTQAEVGAWLGVGPSAVVALVDEGIDLGLVERRPFPGNRRRVLLVLTDLGRARHAGAQSACRELDDEFFAGSTSSERAAFTAILSRAAARLGVGGEGAT